MMTYLRQQGGEFANAGMRLDHGACVAIADAITSARSFVYTRGRPVWRVREVHTMVLVCCLSSPVGYGLFEAVA
jgi:hypothetical protein